MFSGDSRSGVCLRPQPALEQKLRRAAEDTELAGGPEYLRKAGTRAVNVSDDLAMLTVARRRTIITVTSRSITKLLAEGKARLANVIMCPYDSVVFFSDFLAHTT